MWDTGDSGMWYTGDSGRIGDYFRDKALDYFHGDYDLKSLIKEIGVDEVLKVVKQVVEES